MTPANQLRIRQNLGERRVRMIALFEAIQEFLTYLKVEVNRSGETIKGYEKDLTQFHRYYLSQWKVEPFVDEIETHHLRTFFATCRKRKTTRPTASFG
ncbi:site-specific integrase [Brevibacillus thermoruber]|uniref:site-specific integrase n=1 Tax=Brevibacillus thermoruber TaxID=33942 RepID=UPI0040434455